MLPVNKTNAIEHKIPTKLPWKRISDSNHFQNFGENIHADFSLYININSILVQCSKNGHIHDRLDTGDKLY